MATKQSSTPSFFNFLKEGLLLPRRNRGLFAAVFVLIVASTSLFILTNDLTVQPITEEIRLDVEAINGTDPRSPGFAKLLKEIQDDSRELMITSAAILLLATVVTSAVRIVVLFATVATYAGDLYTFGALLGKAKKQFKGPLLTLAFVYVLEVAYGVLLAAMAAVLAFLMVKQYYVLMLPASLILLTAAVFFIYFSCVCSLSVVVAVAESGCHSAGAVGRARRLVKGKRWRAVLFLAVTGVLGAAVSPVHKLAASTVPESVATGLLLDLVYAILIGAVDLFAVCAITAFYYECTESKEVMAAAEYVKVSTEEATA